METLRTTSLSRTTTGTSTSGWEDDLGHPRSADDLADALDLTRQPASRDLD